MSRWPGRLITKTPVTPSGPAPTSTAPGVWTLPEVAYWQKQGRWPSASADPYWSYVSYLLGTTATNAAQNNTFLDSSTNNFTITRYGNTTQGSFTPYGPLWSNYFDGSGDYLQTASNAALGLSGVDFTIEAWVYVTSSTEPYQHIVKSSSGSNNLMFINYSGGSAELVSQAGATAATKSGVTLNAWHHLAVVRSGSNVTCYVDGVGGTAQTMDPGASGAVSLYVGFDAATRYFNGYISNLRVVKGTALYTSAFAPPTAPLTAISGTSLLTCQSNRFCDASSNNFAVTKAGETLVSAFSPFVLAPPGYDTSVNAGSAYFNGRFTGSDPYLTAPSNTAFSLSNGDFTLECWVYETDISYNVGYMGSWGGSYILYREGPTFKFYYSGPAGSPLTPSVSAVANMWTHLAVVRNGSTLTFYVNGVVGASASVGTTAFSTATNPFYIGANQDNVGATAMTGYMSGARLVKGTAIYTAAFTPPTTPPTAVSGTSILCNFTNAGVFDAAMKSDMVTVGNAQVSTGQAKFGTTSAYFDGSGDVLLSPAGPLFNFGTGDFTVEFWMYKTSSAAYQRMVAYGAFAASGNFQIEATDDTTLTVHVNGGYVSTTVPNLLNSWVYVTVTRQSGSVRVFTNGTLRSTNTQAGSVSQTNPFSVGAVYDASSPYTGYIDDLRVTKGYARYTATFTAPTAALPTY